MSVTHATFKIERRYPCTPHEAFRAFAAPELKRQWFVIPGNWPNAKWKLDFRVGGSEFHSGGAPGGRHNAFQARYHDIGASEGLERVGQVPAAPALGYGFAGAQGCQGVAPVGVRTSST